MEGELGGQLANGEAGKEHGWWGPGKACRASWGCGVGVVPGEGEAAEVLAEE